MRSCRKFKNETIEGNVIKDFHTLSQLKLSDKDSELIQNALLILIKLDKEDPSQTAVLMLAPLYKKNSSLFVNAAKKIMTPENKKLLAEIDHLMQSDGGND